MNQQERFEAFYADQHGVPVESMTAYRLADTYRLPGIAAHYRTFKAAQADMVIELPSKPCYRGYAAYDDAMNDARAAIEAAGATVKGVARQA